MTTRPATEDQRYSTTPHPGARGTSAWVGWIGFAAVVLALMGVVQVVEGFAALVDPGSFEDRGPGLLMHLGLSSWGWAHILTGVLLLVACVGVLGGWLWARLVGTVVAGISAVVHLGFLAARPAWSLLMIALCVVVILALTVHGGEIRPDAPPDRSPTVD